MCSSLPYFDICISRLYLAKRCMHQKTEQDAILCKLGIEEGDGCDGPLSWVGAAYELIYRGIKARLAETREAISYAGIRRPISRAQRRQGLQDGGIPLLVTPMAWHLDRFPYASGRFERS